MKPFQRGRVCVVCKQYKPRSKFYVVPDSTRLQSRCKECHSRISRELSRTKYWKNPKEARRKARIQTMRSKQPKREYVDLIKSTTPCRDCGRKFPAVCLDLDHKPRTRKFKGVAALVHSGGYSLEQVKREVEKCEVICACCHRLRTQRRKQYRPRIN